MTHTDRSAALLQVNTPLIVLGAGPGSITSSSHDLAPPRNPDHENAEKLFNVFVTCFSNAFLTFIMCLQTILRIDFKVSFLLFKSFNISTFKIVYLKY